MNKLRNAMADSDINKDKTEADPAAKEKQVKNAGRPMVELKNSKVVFRQKCMSFEKLSETMQEIVNFREMLQRRVENNEPPLDSVPEEHMPLIPKLVQESDKSLHVLSKHIQQQLLPSQDDDEDEDVNVAVLPMEVVETSIKSVAKRINYGLDGLAGGSKVPASLCVWRWEVLAAHRDWLPKASREKIEARYQERVQAKQDLSTLFGSLTQDERDALLNTKSLSKQIQGGKDKANVVPESDVVELGVGAPKVKNENAEGANNNESGQEVESPTAIKCPGRPTKQLDPELAAKEKERKAAKAEKDKKKKEAQEKSRSIMANFFSKPSASPSKPSKGAKDTNCVAGPSTSQSEFERTFKPFVLKKGAELAPANWFEAAKKKRHIKDGKVVREIIVIDDDEIAARGRDGDVQMKDLSVKHADIRAMGAEEHISSVLATLPPSVNQSLVHRPRQALRHFKACGASHSIREILSSLNEAEIAGDVPRVRDLLSLLRSRAKIPAKAFCFLEDARPGYFGTFTRTSRIIGARSPLTRDAVACDYNCDSGEEWEEEGEGEVVEGSDDENGDGGADEADSDLDSWLVDDDEEVEEVGMPIDEREDSLEFPSVILPSKTDKKRKSVEAESGGKQGKKRKAVVQLVPFTKGPCWETVVGRCEYEPFESYKIRLFNDTPYPVDPFTFVSEAPPTALKNPTTTGVFLVPPIPSHVLSSFPSGSNAISTPPPPPASSSLPKKTANAIPKTPFPEDHVATLLAKIRSSSISNLTVLVESIYTSLQQQGVRVRKNAVEMKVREVGEKCKARRIWVVKGESQDLPVMSIPSLASPPERCES